jgi:NhaA family Na+:H+ antiporter
MAKQILKFFKSESAGGVLLFLAAIVATIIENSAYREIYREFLGTKIAIGPEALALKKTLAHWIDDFLMVFFFLVVGLELKREWLEGELRSIKRVMLPGIAALGGMIAPALIFILINRGIDAHQAGWAIPAATDIAFSLAILSLLGKRVPHSLRIFLTSLAIFDDLGAIIIIALFYSAGLSIPHLLGAGVVFVLMLGLNRLRVSRILPYLILGAVLWYLTLKSGIHATIAGVLMAFTIPAQSADGSHSPLKHLEHLLHPWVAFLVLPIFAFANGGLNFSSISVEALGNPLALGVLLGLFAGKQLGVFGAAWIALKTRIAPMPTNSSWGALYGISLITGIGFTMSLFIGALAFPDSPLVEVAKSGTIVGSLLSAVAGYAVLRVASAKE